MTRAPSFEDVLSSHGAMIKRIAAAHESDPSLREDLVQDIVFALWRALPAYRDEAPLRVFVARIAANRSVTHVRRAIRARPPAEWAPECPEAEPSPEAKAIAADETTLLLGAVSALPVSLKETALLAMEGFGPGEIASVIGITTNAVAIRMSRARAAIRQRIGGENGSA